MTSAHRDYMTVKEAAAELGVSPSTIWRWIEAGRLPAQRIGPKIIRLKAGDVETAAGKSAPKGGRAARENGIQEVQQFQTVEEFKRSLKPRTEEEIKKFDEALRRADEIREQIRKDRGGKPVPESWHIIREWRDKR